jgi:hypothetical protein
MPDFTWFFGLFKNFKSFQKDIPLTYSISDLPYGSPVRVFNGGRSGNAYSPMKFISGYENNSRKTSLF